MFLRFLLVGTLLPLALQAQYLAPKPPPIDSSDHLSDALHLGKPSEREAILRRLGVEPETARLAAAPSETGLQAEKIEGSDASLLYVPCSTTLNTAHLYLLGKGMGVTDDAPLSCWWRNASYNFVFLPGHRSLDILAHHSNASHGTGEVADDMVLLEPHGGRWVTLLRTTDYKRTDLPDEAVEQASTLQPFPDGSLDETRTTIVHRGGTESDPAHARLKAVERRRWQWNTTARTYAPGPFTHASR